MKKILLLLLLATFSIQAQTLQNPTYGNVKLKNNTTDNSATKVNVQSTDGTINTISKSDLVNVVEVNDAPSLPLIGEDGKIYVVKNINKIYRWNITFYQELAVTDVSGKANLLGGNSFTGDQNLISINGNGKLSLLPIRNQFASTYNQPFYQSDFGYNVFRPYDANIASRFYIMPNGSPTGTTSKFEMFNTDYYSDFTNYSGFNILLNNATNTIGIGANRGSGGGTRQSMIFYGDYVGSNNGTNANSLNFLTDNTLALNQYTGGIGFGTTNTDPFGFSITNQYTFMNPELNQATRLNIVGNGNSAGALFFGRTGVRTGQISMSGATSSLDIALNKTNSGNALTSYFKILGDNGNAIFADGGSFIDNGSRLQVAGNITASNATLSTHVPTWGQTTVSPAFTGVPTAPTAAAGTNTTQIATTAFVQTNSRPYKVYTALLSQAGTDAPVATVLENTLGSIVWTRVSTGVYYGTLTGAFIVNKTYIQAAKENFNSSTNTSPDNINRVQINVVDNTGTLVDGKMAKTSIEIRVYN